MALSTHADIRDPYQDSIMAFLVVGSISTLTPYGGSPRSIDTVLSSGLLMVWSIMFLGGSVLTLVGIAWRGRYITALGIERVGLILHTGACLIYTVALVTNWGQRNGAFMVTTFIAAIAVANLRRIHRINRSMQRIVEISLAMDKEGE